MPYLRIVRATYGKGNRVVDVTDKLQQLVHNKGGYTLDEFGYWFKPNGKMNEMFGKLFALFSNLFSYLFFVIMHCGFVIHLRICFLLQVILVQERIRTCM